jgi:rod shape determining protein RodA
VKHWANFDLQLIAIPLALVAFGELVLYAISRWPTSGVTVSTPVHQAMYALMGLLALFFLANFDYRMLRSIAFPLYGINLALLAVVLVIGQTTYGAQRWLNLGILPLQPSEPMKLLLALVLAKYFADNEDRLDDPRVVLTSLVFALVPAGMVLAQPDLGTSAVLLAIWVGVALMAGVRMVHFVMLAVAALLATPIALLVLSHVHKFAYMQKRFLIFLNPQQDPLGEGYNVIHSLITVGSGGLLGQWFQQGTQSQLGLLRVEDKDFIFSVIAEQIGFLGVLCLLGIFVMLLMRIARVSFMAGDNFGRLVSSGILAMLMFQVFVNVGMNVGLMPVTGIPLPLLSYGGSSLITTLASFGILQSVLLRHQKLVFAAG